jgi:site-specific DNA-cytosine methylase
MNVLSTFNGMGCIWLALDLAGIKVEKRYSCEIDSFANIINDKNYPDTIQLGDVKNVNTKHK